MVYQFHSIYFAVSDKASILNDDAVSSLLIETTLQHQ